MRDRLSTWQTVSISTIRHDVCVFFCRSLTTASHWALEKRINRSRCCLGFGMWLGVGPRNHVFGGTWIPQGKGHFFWGGAYFGPLWSMRISRTSHSYSVGSSSDVAFHYLYCSSSLLTWSWCSLATCLWAYQVQTGSPHLPSSAQHPGISLKSCVVSLI